MRILIKNGRVIDPDTKTDTQCDIFIREGRIKEINTNIKKEADRIVDAAGCYVMPGLIDLHVHLRDPGFTHKEDIASGARAAAKGGFTTIVTMPNTKPVIDNGDRVNYVHHKASQQASIHVLQVGAITKGQKGEELADIEEMIEAGIPAISEDGRSVMNARIYKEAMQIAKKHEIPVFAHCEDDTLAAGGYMNEGKKARELGLDGIPNSAEDVIAARDILLAKNTGARLHLCHCSTKDSVRMVELAKQEGISVTAEVCPHHFTLSTEDIQDYDTNYKMNPPLRTKKDVDALKQGLKEDIIQVISTDHAPHSSKEKERSMQEAPFGIVGLETCVALTISELVTPGVITPMQMAEKLSYYPAQIIGSDRGSLAPGKPADVVVIDPDADYCIDVRKFVSKGKNTPFHGRKVQGEVIMTICDGQIVYEREKDD